jgi:MFS family permease
MVANASGEAPATTSAAGEMQTLLVVSAAHLVSHLHIMVLPVLLPLLKERMNVGFFELGLALTTFNVVSGLTQAPMGFLVDRIGARRVLIAGLLLGGAAFLSLAMSGAYGWLIVVALVAGLANCVYHPADYAILNDSISESRVGRAFSVHTFAGFVGSAIAPPLLLGLAAAAGMDSSVVAAGLVAWAVAALVFLIPDQQRARRDERARSNGGGGGASVNVFTPAVLGLTVFFTLLALSHSAMYSFAIVALLAGHGVTLTVATAAVTAYLAGSAVGVLLGGPVADRTRRHGDVAAAGFAISALISLAIAVLDLPVALLVAAMGVVGVVIGMVQPSRDMLVRRAAPPGAAGRVFGIVSTGFNIGGIIGPMLFGWMMDHGAPRGVFAVACGFMAAIALFGFVEERRVKRARAQAAGS